MINPSDSDGNLCGRGEYSGRPYVYFFDWTKCLQSLNIPSNLIRGKPFVCPTKQICVEHCPNETTFSRLKNYRSHVVCTYQINIHNQSQNDFNSLIESGQCPSYILGSKPLFGRCVPQQIQSLANSFISVKMSFGRITIFLNNSLNLRGYWRQWRECDNTR